MDSTVSDTNRIQTRYDYSRVTNLEQEALDKLALAQKQIDQCSILVDMRGYSDSAYRQCDLALQNLQQSKSLWMSRD